MHVISAEYYLYRVNVRFRVSYRVGIIRGVCC